MRKLLFLFIFVLSFVFVVSCKSKTKFNNMDYQNIDYYVAGIYVQVDNEGTPTVGDNNPYFYFDLSKHGYSKDNITGVINGPMFYSAQGLYSVFSKEIYKNVNQNSDPILCYANISLALEKSNTSITLYPIYVSDDGTTSVDVNRSAIVKVNGPSRYQYVSTFTNEKNYKLNFEVNFN